MRRNSLLILAALMIAALLTYPALPPSDAQDSTPFPASTPATLVPSTNDPMVVRLPFGETFDTNWGWTPTGAWQYDTETAYDTGAWFVDGVRRETVSTLEYAFPIDMQGTLSAQLIYRERGRLPASDLIAVDLSLDGGETWFLIDAQIGVEADWDTHIVDLTSYRGQIIRLRFRVTTGVRLPEPEPAESEIVESEAPTTDETGEEAEEVPIPEGYWIDNLTIQYVLTPPDFEFLVFDSHRARMGLHLIVGAQKEPVVELATRLRDIGWPLNTLKGTTGTEDILNAVAEVSPDTTIIYRSLETPWGMIDCPNTFNDPVAEAQIWMDGILPYLNRVNADYYEIMNECHPPMAWLVPFTVEAMRLAGSAGKCILAFSFGPGNPEIADFAQLLPVYQYALEHPCQPGRYHGIALHAYGIGKTTLVSESGIYLGLRHRLYYAHILTQLPEAIFLPVYLTEAGPGDGIALFTCADITRDVIQYTQQLEYDPYIRGFELWSVGGIGQWLNVTSCLPMLTDALIRYYAAK